MSRRKEAPKEDHETAARRLAVAANTREAEMFLGRDRADLALVLFEHNVTLSERIGDAEGACAARRRCEELRS